MKLYLIFVSALCLTVINGQTCEEELSELKEKMECYRQEPIARLCRYCQDPVPIQLLNMKSGNITIYPSGVNCDNGVTRGIDVYCDQRSDGGGWIVFQRRRVRRPPYKGKKLNFYRNWSDYRNGFGDVNGEFWLGLKNLNRITRTGDFELRVDLKLFEGKNATYAKYEHFSVSGEKTNFRLNVSGYSGSAGDSLSYHDGQPFSTFDRDNDGREMVNCAKENWGGWWYSNGDQDCHRSNLNGRFNRWFKSSPIKDVEMKIRRRDRRYG